MDLAQAVLASLAALIQLQGDQPAAGRLHGSVRVPLERAVGGDTPVLSFTSPRGSVRLLLDTGASSALLTPAAAARLGLASRAFPPGAFALAGGGSGCRGLQPRRSLLPDLFLRGSGEGVALRGMEALVLTVGGLPAGVDGVLGAPTLRQLPIRVNPLVGQLNLGRAALSPGAAGSGEPRRLALQWRQGVPVMRLDSVTGPVDALADSGAEGLFVSPALAARLHPLGPPSALRLSGVCGEQAVRRQSFAGLALPETRSGNTPVEARNAIVTSNPIFRELAVEAILGQELLRDRVQLWRLDVPDPRLELW